MSRLASLGLRNLGRNRARAGLAAFAILVGVCQMVAGQAFVNGFLAAIIEDAVQTRVGAIQVYRAGFLEAEQEPLRFDLPGDPAFAAKLQKAAGARAVSGRIAFDGSLSSGRVSAHFVATAIDPRTEYEVCPRRRSLAGAGSSPLEAGDESGVLVGAALAEGLGGAIGGALTLSATGRNGRPNALDGEIRGLLPEGNSFENKAGLVLPLSRAQALLGMEGRVTEYVLDLDDLARADEAAASLRHTLGGDYEVRTYRDRPQIRQFESSMKFILVVVIFLLAVLVGSVITNAMLTSVYERVREIGTMMAFGVRRRQIISLFLVEATLIGLCGSLAGAALSLLVIRLFGGGIHIPATSAAGALVVYPRIGAGFVAAAIVVAVLVAVTSALYPALRASRMRPADALRAL